MSYLCDLGFSWWKLWRVLSYGMMPSNLVDLYWYFGEFCLLFSCMVHSSTLGCSSVLQNICYSIWCFLQEDSTPQFSALWPWIHTELTLWVMTCSQKKYSTLLVESWTWMRPLGQAMHKVVCCQAVCRVKCVVLVRGSSTKLLLPVTFSPLELPYVNTFRVRRTSEVSVSLICQLWLIWNRISVYCITSIVLMYTNQFSKIIHKVRVNLFSQERFKSLILNNFRKRATTDIMSKLCSPGNREYADIASRSSASFTDNCP